MLNGLKYAPEPVSDMEIPSNFRISGWVYVLSNECMPGIFKIGMTTNDPEIRAKEISQGTGVPSPFSVVRAYFSDNPREDELVIHEDLAEYRFNPGREFFRCPIEVIDECISSNSLFQKNEAVCKIADDYSIISFEQSDSLDLDELFEAIGISIFGNRIAIAERLIEMGVNTIKRLNRKGMSLVFSDGVAIPVIQDLHRRYEEHMAQLAKDEAVSGIYGPQMPPDNSALPF